MGIVSFLPFLGLALSHAGTQPSQGMPGQPGETELGPHTLSTWAKAQTAITITIMGGFCALDLCYSHL